YQQTLQYYQSQYGYDEEYLNQIARYYYGYDTFYDYMLYSNKSMAVFKDYIKTNIADLLTDEKKAELNPRIVSYVVIAMDDPANPTAEESSKLKAAQDAWASDTYTAENFGDFAAAYSQDGNAANKGVFGYIDTKTTGIDETFLNTALSLKDGEVSEWVYSEQFGYFLIKCDTSDTAALLEEDDFVSEVLNMNEGLQNKVMWQKAEELGVSYGDEEVEKIIKDHMNVNESEGN
ncbi:MAG: peptidylprolyl isomerase, partial [Erysipelotrichaceae bacterium]|nr:peptidylprolyl isomerase [Erysipelotrichaceae bacterium]